MLTWALADDLKNESVTAVAVNPGYVLTPLTRNTTGPLKILTTLTGFAAHDPLAGADTAIWAATSPEIEGVTGKFWNRRDEIPCHFRNTTKIRKLRAIVEQQLADAGSLVGDPRCVEPAAIASATIGGGGPIFSSAGPSALRRQGSWQLMSAFVPLVSLVKAVVRMTLWETVRGLARRAVAVTSQIVGQVIARARAHGAPTASVGVGAMLAGTSLWGLLRADLYPEPASVAAMFRGLDTVSLAIAAPTLLAAVWRSRHGSARAQLVWLAVLAYVTYTYLLYAFGLGWTAALPLHVALVVLASVALAGRLRCLDREELARILSGGSRQRAAGVLLAALGVGLGAMWGFYLGRYALTGQALPEAQLVQTSHGALLSATADLLLLVPAYLVAALLLWRRSSWGHPVGAALLAAGLLQQVGYQAELFVQSASGIPGARAFDPAEPLIAALYVVGVVLLFGQSQRALPLPEPPVGRRPALPRA